MKIYKITEASENIRDCIGKQIGTDVWEKVCEDVEKRVRGDVERNVRLMARVGNTGKVWEIKYRVKSQVGGPVYLRVMEQVREGGVSKEKKEVDGGGM